MRVFTAGIGGLHGLLREAAHLGERRGCGRRRSVVAAAHGHDRASLGLYTSCWPDGYRNPSNDEAPHTERETRREPAGPPKSTFTPPMAKRAARGSSSWASLQNREEDAQLIGCLPHI